MIHSPGLLLTLVAFIGVIGPLVFIHEMGHYLVGRWCGVKAEVFSIGFGRELIGLTDRRGTRWKLGWLPLGGYVRFAGDMTVASQPSAEWLALPSAERNQTFQSKPVGQRALIVAAGPAVNLLAALVILAGFAMIYGDLRVTPVVDRVLPGGAAARAGIRAGDRITAVDGATVRRFDEIGRAILLRGGEHVTLTLERGSRSLKADALIATAQQQDQFGNRQPVGRLGILGGKPEIVRVGPVPAIAVAAREIGAVVSLTTSALARVITGRTSVSLLHGPVGTAKMAGEQLSVGWPAFIGLIAMVSINLGFINLLPVPMLDGGHLFFYAVEAVRRRPVGPAAQEWAYRGGLAAILTLMLLVTFNDLSAAGAWSDLGHRLAGLID